MKKLTLFLLFLPALISCETEVDVVAPEQDIPVIYAVFNHQDDTHFVKINRLLQGSESFDSLAGNRDLAEYENLTVYFAEYEAFTSGTRETTYEQSEIIGELKPTEINNKEAGPFHHPDQTVYYTTAELDPQKLYGIEFETPEGTRVEGVTPLINVPPFNVLGSREQIWRNNGFSFVQGNSVNDNLVFRVTQPVGSKALQATIYLEYREISLDQNDNPYISKVDEISLGLGQSTYNSVREESATTAGQTDLNFSPQRFYQLIADQFPDIDESPGVVQRRMDTMRIEITFISEDMHIYTEVSSPSQSILEDKPPFTNFNTGVGVIGSRARYIFRSGFNRATQEELKNALLLGLTGSKGFCNTREPNDCLL